MEGLVLVKARYVKEKDKGESPYLIDGKVYEVFYTDTFTGIGDEEDGEYYYVEDEDERERHIQPNGELVIEQTPYLAKCFEVVEE